MDMDTALAVSWHECTARCGAFHPVSDRAYCCASCALASQGKYTLDYHTGACDERQRFYVASLEKREADSRDSLNGHN